MKGDAVVSTTSRSGGPATPGDELSFDRYPDQCIRTLYGHADAIDAIALDMPFGTLVSASRDATLRVWDLSSQTCRALLRNLGQNKAGFTATELSPSAPQILFSGDAKGQILQWDLARLADPLLTSAGSICTRMFPSDAHTGAITCLMADAETLVSGSDDGTVRVWDAESGKCLLCHRVLTGHLDGVTQVRFAGNHVVTASKDHTLKVWDLRLASGGLASGFSGHTKPVSRVKWVGERLVSCGLDQTVKVWRV
ncbi:hypothetical protein CXG81DRAFT_13310 [Caulochytrium protostelioides]|uniref:WD40 repeat-like protein n=1 Tax=Caulochytrium protostelioides TaxID=1555241 RepID=A0A4P9X5G9_9FUNG|nr:WD40 repeat-like protein [Caulochytrium protostelioides]RKP00378.1 hypothetical protein CXG81DRAFT_13310 [Caulochytrium protostelioides]|eukprot:RKP00378.1 hypothetical protein CXG81DRAFT_13310 [Caulochytrium protostelioides]